MSSHRGLACGHSPRGLFQVLSNVVWVADRGGTGAGRSSISHGLSVNPGQSGPPSSVTRRQSQVIAADCTGRGTYPSFRTFRTDLVPSRMRRDILTVRSKT